MSGSIDAEAGFDLAQKWFGHIPGKDRAPLQFSPVEILDKKIHKTVYGEVPSPAIYFAFKMKNRLDRGFFTSLISYLISSPAEGRQDFISV